MIKKLAKEDRLVGGIMESDVFRIASRIGHDTLFPGSPGDHAGPQRKTVTTVIAVDVLELLVP